MNQVARTQLDGDGGGDGAPSRKGLVSGVWLAVECALLSLLATALLLFAVHNLWREKRQSFVNTFVLLNRTIVEERKKRGARRELLALFSNPSAPQQLQLRPLQLGQELKFLLRSVPAVELECEPAASLEDARMAIERCDPSLILFSGHSFAGSLAFELPNGRIDLPPPNLFIEKLTHAGRLQCCFLNGCLTGELAATIVSQLPHLKAICWSSVAEDAAARSFALGFYDAIGAFLSSGEEIATSVELAFWAGLEHFFADGFRLGDPARYLHPPDHPHVQRPQFSPPCQGW